ncbi:hypothetical protein UPYG_G00034390 [Umbra pygmaea]|uniref:Metalloprotease TIKI n=1 Tax=Umbra pygmaea TaxID=75934 RepID=A0ABD0XNH1_UMBPY
MDLDISGSYELTKNIFLLGHFLGNHSVLDILRQEGYEVVHTPSHYQEPITEEPTEIPSFGVSNSGTATASDLVISPSDMDGLEDEEEELPHLLLPDSLSQLEEFGRHKRPRKARRGHGHPRLFSDLWVRIGHGTTPHPNVRITNGYVTVEPPLTHQEQKRRTYLYPPLEPPSQASSSAPPTPSSAQPTIFITDALMCLLALLMSHLRFAS